jgi:hypothetical protein
MAQAERFPNFANFATRGMFARILLLAIFRAAQANKQGL